jgi:3',5'-cyclic AMP phosphodiesterase CpdA
VKRIAHISDLHFGTEVPEVVEGLVADIDWQSADLLIVSGDLTQRARRGQYRKARASLDRVALPRIVVPGNHDIPLYNVAARFLLPLTNYRRYITAELCPQYADGEIAVAGVNTARSNTWVEGRISPEQLDELREFFEKQPAGATKVLVAHHPFIPPIIDAEAELVGGVLAALKTLEACGCHLILSGHLHLAYAGDVRPYHVEIERSILVVQAGTAVSHRRRGEPNAYNLLTLDGPRLWLEVRRWNGLEFEGTLRTEYDYEAGGWMRRETV